MDLRKYAASFVDKQKKKQNGVAHSKSHRVGTKAKPLLTLPSGQPASSHPPGDLFSVQNLSRQWGAPSPERFPPKQQEVYVPLLWFRRKTKSKTTGSPLEKGTPRKVLKALRTEPVRSENLWMRPRFLPRFRKSWRLSSHSKTERRKILKPGDWLTGPIVDLGFLNRF